MCANQHENHDLESLSTELEQVFLPERSLLTVGLREKVKTRLPKTPSPLVRVARGISLVVLLGAAACVVLAAGVVLSELPAWTLWDRVRLLVGGVAVLLSVGFTVAAPRLVWWDSRLLARLFHKTFVPGAADVLAVRAGALVLLLMGAALLL